MLILIKSYLGVVGKLIYNSLLAYFLIGKVAPFRSVAGGCLRLVDDSGVSVHSRRRARHRRWLSHARESLAALNSPIQFSITAKRQLGSCLTFESLL